MDGRGNSSHALAKGLCAAVRPNPLPELAELGPLLGQLHLACLEGGSESLPLIEVRLRCS